ncbi:MAG: cation diffusion facilitator family transporter [Bdellovibrionales bacterium]
MNKPSRFLLSANKLRQVTSYASVAVALSLIAAKLVAYMATDSVALLSSLVDSGVDLLASLITAYGVFIALRPPDRDHRFGHGKAEALAALAQAIFIFMSSGLLIKEAVHRFWNPAPLQRLDIGYGVMGLAVVMTIALLALQTYTIRRTRSLAIASDRLHYVGDVAINIAVMASFALGEAVGVPWLDPLFALLIAASMCIGAIKITRQTLLVLMDAEMPEKDREAIVALAMSVKGVLGVHDLRTRFGGERPIIEAHIEMPATLSLVESHDIAEAVMAKIEIAYPKADVLVHQDPAGVQEHRLDTVIEQNDPVKE